MPPHPRPSQSHGLSRGNLFIEHALDEQPEGTRAVAPSASAPGRRRGLVVPVDKPAARAAATSAGEQFSRAPGRANRLAQRARDHARRRDHDAQRLLARVAGRRYGSLLSLIAVVALVLVIGWLGMSLRDVAGARDRAERQQRAAALALGEARARMHMLAGQRDEAINAARSARRRQAAMAAHDSAGRARPRAAGRQARRRSRR